MYDRLTVYVLGCGIVIAQWSERRQIRSEALGSIPSGCPCIFSRVSILIYHQFLPLVVANYKNIHVHVQVHVYIWTWRCVCHLYSSGNKPHQSKQHIHKQSARTRTNANRVTSCLPNRYSYSYTSYSYRLQQLRDKHMSQALQTHGAMSCAPPA